MSADPIKPPPPLELSKRYTNPLTGSWFERSSNQDISKARLEDLKSLEMFFLQNLAEDPIDGTGFDCRVLEAIDNVRTWVKNRPYVGFKTNAPQPPPPPTPPKLRIIKEGVAIIQ